MRNPKPLKASTGAWQVCDALVQSDDDINRAVELLMTQEPMMKSKKKEKQKKEKEKAPVPGVCV